LLHKIAFEREGKTVIGKVYNWILEPLEAGGKYKHQLIYFAEDQYGRRYRVPKSEVLLKSQEKPKKLDKKSKKGKKKKRTA